MGHVSRVSRCSVSRARGKRSGQARGALVLQRDDDRSWRGHSRGRSRDAAELSRRRRSPSGAARPGSLSLDRLWWPHLVRGARGPTKNGATRGRTSRVRHRCARGEGVEPTAAGLNRMNRHRTHAPTNEKPDPVSLGGAWSRALSRSRERCAEWAMPVRCDRCETVARCSCRDRCSEGALCGRRR